MMIHRLLPQRRHGFGLGCFLTALVLTPAIALADGDPARLSRGHLLEDIRTLQRAHHHDPADDLARWKELETHADAFLTRFRADPETAAVRHARGMARLHRQDAPGAIDDFSAVIRSDPDSPRGLMARYLRGLAHTKALDDVTGRADLLAVREHDDSAPSLRDRCDYTIATLDTRNGEEANAAARLRELIERGEADESVTTRADNDLRDLIKIGADAPPLPAFGAEPVKAARVVIAVLYRQPTGDAASDAPAPLREAKAAAGDRPPTDVMVLALPVESFEDPAVKAFQAPALPRVYVLERSRGRLRLRGAGLRRDAIKRRVRTLLGAIKPPAVQPPAVKPRDG